jgi:hypothetical protein
MLVVKLTIASIASYFITMVTLWSASSLPGSHIYAHMVYGLGEASACFLASLLCRFYNDRLVFNGFCAVGLLGLSAFYFICGGSSASIAGLISFGIQVVGCGGVFSIQFLLIEQRVSPAKLSSTITLTMTVALIITSCSTMVAFAPQPIPFLLCVSAFVIGIAASSTLPDPKVLVKNPALYANQSLIAAYEYTYIGDNPNVPDTTLASRSILVQEWDRQQQLRDNLNEWVRVN